MSVQSYIERFKLIPKSISVWVVRQKISQRENEIIEELAQAKLIVDRLQKEKSLLQKGKQALLKSSKRAKV